MSLREEQPPCVLTMRPLCGVCVCPVRARGVRPLRPAVPGRPQRDGTGASCASGHTAVCVAAEPARCGAGPRARRGPEGALELRVTRNPGVLSPLAAARGRESRPPPQRPGPAASRLPGRARAGGGQPGRAHEDQCRRRAPPLPSERPPGCAELCRPGPDLRPAPRGGLRPQGTWAYGEGPACRCSSPLSGPGLSQESDRQAGVTGTDQSHWGNSETDCLLSLARAAWGLARALPRRLVTGTAAAARRRRARGRSAARRRPLRREGFKSLIADWADS